MSIPLACDINTFKIVQLNQIIIVYEAIHLSLRYTYIYNISVFSGPLNSTCYIADQIYSFVSV